MSAHRHEALKSTERPFFACPAGRDCEGGAAHGGFIEREVCSCGATRESARNGNHKPCVGPWLEADGE